MIPTDFVQNSSGDLDFSLGLRRTSTLSEYVVQKISQTLNLIQGEEASDTRLGVPWPRYVWGHRYDPPLVELIYRRALLATTGVGAVPRLVFDFDSRGRTLAVDGVVRTIEGDVVPFRELIVGVT